MSMEKPSRSLDSVLRELAQDDARQGASADVQARLLEKVRSMAARRRRRVYTAVVLTAAAASVAGAVLMVPDRMPPDARPVASSATEPAETATPFLPLGGATLPPADGYIVRLELPRAALVQFGLGQAETLPASSSTNTLLADVLVGEDGVARGVRFVHQR
jgi:hypothetical protein